MAAGRVTSLRRVSAAGTVTVLSQAIRFVNRHRALDLRLVVDSGHGWLKGYPQGRVLKRCASNLLDD